ncbi:unnamed protein product, partial [Didymodactylos carnosus]
MLQKDLIGSVSGIIMPNQAHHFIERQTTLNGHKLIYTGLQSSSDSGTTSNSQQMKSYIWEYDSNDNFIRLRYPSDSYSMLTHIYNQTYLNYIFYDGIKVMFSYDMNDNPSIIKTNYPYGSASHTIYNQYNGSILKRTINSFKNFPYLTTIFTYNKPIT